MRLSQDELNAVQFGGRGDTRWIPRAPPIRGDRRVAPFLNPIY